MYEEGLEGRAVQAGGSSGSRSFPSVGSDSAVGRPHHLLVRRLEAPSKRFAQEEDHDFRQHRFKDAQSSGLEAWPARPELEDTFAEDATADEVADEVDELQIMDQRLDAPVRPLQLGGSALRVLEKARAELLQRLPDEQRFPGRPVAATSAVGASAPSSSWPSSLQGELVAQAMETTMRASSIGQKAGGSPSELSTAPTATREEVVIAYDGGGLCRQGADASTSLAMRQLASPAGSSLTVSAEGDSPGESCSAVWFPHSGEGATLTEGRGGRSPRDSAATAAARRALAAELEGRLQALSILAQRAARQELRLHAGENLACEDFSAEKAIVEQKLHHATSRARALWVTVENGDARIRQLQASLELSSPPDGFEHKQQSLERGIARAQQVADEAEEKACLLAEREDKLLQQIASKDDDRGRRKVARLTSRIARLKEEHLEIAEQASEAYHHAEELKAEVSRLEVDQRAEAEARRRREEVQALWRARLAHLALGLSGTSSSVASFASLAEHIGQTWAEAGRRGAQALVELNSLQDHRHSLTTEIDRTQARLEADEQRILAAEEELAKRARECRAGDRLAREELTLAQTENAALVKARAAWQSKRPRLVSFLEEGHRSGVQLQDTETERESSSSSKDAALIRQALQEGQALRARIQGLEHDKAHLIHEQAGFRSLSGLQI
ncbi:unnamed protein product [Polarella glacialis]|uniref:Uncharacterized protein n=1 Tax=Polarella glacialis TaxID=89957 RepID=A0A813D5V5_POLGL|nr:unnamed protein product [Polarella glacialis]